PGSRPPPGGDRTLPQLPPFPATDPWRPSDCQFCERPHSLEDPWMEVAISYETHTPDATGTSYAVDVLDESFYVAMCRACCQAMPFPPLQHDDDYDKADCWFASFIHLLAAPMH